MKTAIIFLLALLITSCTSSNHNNRENIREFNPADDLQPIDVRMPFFFILQPWKDGKLVTIDGWGRYAEISFTGINRASLKPLVEFPRSQTEAYGFHTWPEAGVIVSRITDRMHHIAAIDDNKTKSHVPLLTWRHRPTVTLLCQDEGIIAYQYTLTGNDRQQNHTVNTFLYNYKTDTILDNSLYSIIENEENLILMQVSADERFMLSYTSSYNQNRAVSWEYDYFFYDWRTGEITRNDFTRAINKYNCFIRPENINFERRFLFTQRRITGDKNHFLLISWDEDFSNVIVKDITSLAKPFRFDAGRITVSPDGKWLSAVFYNRIERLYERAFFHIDENYPNGISNPIFTNYLEDSSLTRDNIFVNHPVHGMCFAQKIENNNRLYLSLYLMDDVLAKINSQTPNPQAAP
ncbi:MAG: hypothetical protein FWD14_05965 [Treponema sp.]|nr:hypothetical protein [Treponema sp.]